MCAPRMTLRRWMIAVAVLGVLLGTCHLVRLSIEDDRRAREYAPGHFIWEGDGEADLLARQRMTAAEWEVYITRRYETIVAWRDHMHAKYRFASWFPWFPIAPDPPSPE